MLSLQALGGLDLRDEAGEPLEALLKQPKRAALLVYLALAEPAGFHRRDSILLLFWPDLTTERARAALRKSLHVLRGAVGPDVILSRGDDELGIDWQHLDTDIATFVAALTAGRTAEALALYRADLLTGFHLSDASPEWEQWLDGRRSELRRLAAEAAWRHASALAEAGETTEGIRWARWACDRTPDDEPAIRRLLGLLGDLGDRAGALHFYDEFRNRIRADYGAQPAPETQELVRSIKSRVMADALDVPPPDAPVPESAAPVQERRRPSSRPTPAPAEVAAKTRPRWWRPMLIALPFLVVAVAALAIWRGGEAEPVQPDLVAVAPFTVLSPELTVWREGLVDLLSRNLDGAGPLRSVAPTRTIGGAPDEVVSAADLGRRTGAGLVVFGSILAFAGDSVRISAGILDRTSDRSLGTIEIGGTTDRMDLVIDSLTRSLLRDMGRVRQIGSSRVASIGSTSVPALRAFLQGEQFRRRTAWDSARVYFEEAVALDTMFAMAWLRLGEVNTMTRWPVPLSGGRLANPIGLLQISRAGGLNRGLTGRDSLLLEAQASLVDILLDVLPSDSAAWVHATALRATVEYPDDAESWAVLAVVEKYLQESVTTTDASVWAHFSRAIALDSNFAPAIRQALGVAGNLGDVNATRRLAEHLLTLDRAPATRALPMAIVTLLDPRGTRETRAAMLDTAAIEVLWPTFYEIYTLPDSAEAVVQLTRALNARTPDPRYWFAAPGEMRRNLAGVLAFRGHLAEAFQLAGTERSTWFANLLGELAMLGAVPREIVDSTFADWTENHPRTPGIAEATGWWAANRDTAAIKRRSATRGFPDSQQDSAFLALARADTTAALRHFRAERWLAYPPRLSYIRLLVATRDTTEALRLLKRREPNDWPLPSRVVWRLMRARLEEGAGEGGAAAADYRFVIDAWRNADPLLQPFVEEARQALGRLGGIAPTER